MLPKLSPVILALSADFEFATITKNIRLCLQGKAYDVFQWQATTQWFKKAWNNLILTVMLPVEP